MICCFHLSLNFWYERKLKKENTSKNHILREKEIEQETSRGTKYGIFMQLRSK